MISRNSQLLFNFNAFTSGKCPSVVREWISYQAAACNTSRQVKITVYPFIFFLIVIVVVFDVMNFTGSKKMFGSKSKDKEKDKKEKKEKEKHEKTEKTDKTDKKGGLLRRFSKSARGKLRSR